MADFSKAKGNKTLQSVASKSALMKAGAVVKQLPVQELKDNPDNEYLFGMEQSDIEHTAVGIKKNGFKGAINVYSCPDGTYEVYSGHIRKYAAIEAGLNTIPCLVEPEPELTVKRRQLLGANLYGRNKIAGDNPILVARQIHYHRETLELEEFKGDTREQIALDFRISGSQVYKYEALLGLEPELQELVAERQVPWSILYSAKSFSKTEQEKLASALREAVEAASEPISKRQVKVIMEQLLGNKPMEGQLSITDFEDESSMEGVHGEQVPEVVREDTSEDECSDCYLNHNPEYGDMECHPEQGEHMCYIDDEEEEVKQPEPETPKGVHGEQSNRTPSIEEAMTTYHEIGGGIKNYYELKEYLIAGFGKPYAGIHNNGISIRCTPQGIRINSSDEITWTKYLDIIEEHVPLEKTKNKNELEKRIYKLEEGLSTESVQIQWSNATEARKIIKSLISMLEDELDRLSD